MTIVASLRERWLFAPPRKRGVPQVWTPSTASILGHPGAFLSEPLPSKIASVIKLRSAHTGQGPSVPAILVTIVLEGPVDADGLWKAVDGYEVQQEEPAHRFPRALGKPANGRRFPTSAHQAASPGVFRTSPWRERHTPDRLNGREQTSYRRFAPTA